MTIFFDVEGIPTDMYHFHCYPAGSPAAVTYGPYPTLDEAENVASAHYAMCEDCHLYGDVTPIPVLDVNESAYIGDGTDALLFYLLRMDATEVHGIMDAEELLGQTLLLLAMGAPAVFSLTGAADVFAPEFLENPDLQEKLMRELQELADLATVAYQLNRTVGWC